MKRRQGKSDKTPPEVVAPDPEAPDDNIEMVDPGTPVLPASPLRPAESADEDLKRGYEELKEEFENLPEEEIQTEPEAEDVPAALEWENETAHLAYANVVNVSTTIEETTLSFGLTGDGRIVHGQNHTILNPRTAWRLCIALFDQLDKLQQKTGIVFAESPIEIDAQHDTGSP